MNKARYSRNRLVVDIIGDARAIGLAEDFGQKIAVGAADHLEKWLKSRPAATPADITRVVGEYLKQHSEDLAFIYTNRTLF